MAVSVPDYAVMEASASFLNLSLPFVPWFQAKEQMVIWKRKGGRKHTMSFISLKVAALSLPSCFTAWPLESSLSHCLIHEQ